MKINKDTIVFDFSKHQGKPIAIKDCWFDIHTLVIIAPKSKSSMKITENYFKFKRCNHESKFNLITNTKKKVKK